MMVGTVGAQRFQRMDWGPDGNMAAYGTPTPPAYNLTAVAAPVVLFFGDNDWLATPQVQCIRFSLNSVLMYSSKHNIGKHEKGTEIKMCMARQR